MQTQQPNRPLPVTPTPKHTQSTVSPQPWVKPTFEQVPLNEALSGNAPLPNKLDASFGYSPRS